MAAVGVETMSGRDAPAVVDDEDDELYEGLPRPRVLLVEDNEDCLRIGHGVLLILGFHPILATGCAEAIQSILGNNLDAAILDIELRDIQDGIWLLQQLRNWEQVHGSLPGRDTALPVVVASRVYPAHSGAVKDALALGAVFISKPYQLEALNDAVSRAKRLADSNTMTPSLHLTTSTIPAMRFDDGGPLLNPDPDLEAVTDPPGVTLD